MTLYSEQEETSIEYDLLKKSGKNYCCNPPIANNSLDPDPQNWIELNVNQIETT